VLTDGAAAQYGSDAIAGVINIILKKTNNGGNLAALTASTTMAWHHRASAGNVGFGLCPVVS